MASSDSPATFESWLNQATDPNNQEDRWDCIQGFYQLVSQETDGPQVALRLLAHKIQSPQEKEALQALTVLEACMNNCGKRFHSEAAKFRFLNELIKILTPKYYGSWSPQKVKDRVIEVLYGWTIWLKDQPKVQEAYSLLKKQGLVVTDPKLPDHVVMPPLPQRSTESVFDQEDKAKLLSRLLKSTSLEDLETANRLIKNTFKEEQEKAEKVLKRESTLKEVQSSTKQLRELLDQHTITGASLQLGDDIKAVYERCDRLRPSLFRLASDTVDDEAALGQILVANDELMLAVNAYRERVGRGERDGGAAGGESEEASSPNITPTSPRGIKSYHLIDLSALDSPQTHRNADLPPAFESSSPLFFSHIENSTGSEVEPGSDELELLAKQNPQSYYEELMQFDADIQKNVKQNGGRGVLLRSRGCGESSAASNGMNTWSLPEDHLFTESQSVFQSQQQASQVSPMKAEHNSCSPQLLKNVFVPMETIQSSQLEPITLYDRSGIRVSLHFARHSPAGHPDVAVVVMSAVNTSALHLKDFRFQAAAPKNMLVKLQPASDTQLPPYNPLLPPAAVSQVLLLANPHRSSVRLRYKLTLTHGEQQLDETGDISSFPDWGSLIGH